MCSCAGSSLLAPPPFAPGDSHCPAPAYVSIRQHTSAYVSIRLHTSAYVSIRQHTSAYVSMQERSEGRPETRILSRAERAISQSCRLAPRAAKSSRNPPQILPKSPPNPPPPPSPAPRSRRRRRRRILNAFIYIYRAGAVEEGGAAGGGGY